MSVIGAAVAFNIAAKREGWPALCDYTVSFKSPALVALVDTWNLLAAANGVPNRAQFSPHVLKSILPNVAIYERIETEGGEPRYRVRLMGTWMTKVVGNLTGRFLDESVPAPYLARWHASLEATLQTRAPLRFLTRSDTNRMEFLVAEYFSAPMRGSNGSENMVLGVGHYDANRPWPAVERETLEYLSLTSGTTGAST